MSQNMYMHLTKIECLVKTWTAFLNLMLGLIRNELYYAKGAFIDLIAQTTKN